MRVCYLALIGYLINIVTSKIFEKCELAKLLEKKHGFSKDEVKKWVCVAQYESTFNTAAVNYYNWDGSKDFGLFQLNNRYWCGSDYQQNICDIPCSALLDDDLTDDLKCARRIVKDTQRWMKVKDGLVAWVAYKSRCMNRNLDEYMAECWGPGSDTSSVKPEGGQSIVDNIIPSRDTLPAEDSSVKQETSPAKDLSTGKQETVKRKVSSTVKQEIIPSKDTSPVDRNKPSRASGLGQLLRLTNVKQPMVSNSRRAT